MAKKLYEEADIQAIANAIRGKNGLTDTYKTSEMAAAITNLPASGGSEPVIRPLTVTENRTYTAIEGGVDGYAPITVNVPSLDKEIIERTITTYQNSQIETVGMYAFRLCQQLTSIDLPNAKSVGEYGFCYCNLTSINLPKVEDISNYAFSYNKNLTSIVLPACISTGTQSFANCSALTKADFTVATTIGNACFKNCTALNALILRSPTMATLLLGSGLDGSGIAKSAGYIYVPRALVDTYKADTNWQKYSNVIRAIEDYPDITG